MGTWSRHTEFLQPRFGHGGKGGPGHSRTALTSQGQVLRVSGGAGAPSAGSGVARGPPSPRRLQRARAPHPTPRPGPRRTSLVAPTSRAKGGAVWAAPNRIGPSDRHSRAPAPAIKALPAAARTVSEFTSRSRSPRPGRPADRGERRGARWRWGTGPAEPWGALGLEAAGWGAFSAAGAPLPPAHFWTGLRPSNALFLVPGGDQGGAAREPPRRGCVRRGGQARPTPHPRQV